MKYEVAVLGGGAAGLAASAMLHKAGKRTVLCEKGARVGKKLLSTGSGTCNLSNLDLSVAHYHSLGGDAASFVAPALGAFSLSDTRAFFSSVGVETEPDARGRVYPVCRSAGAVLDCLRFSLGDVLTDFDVTELRKENGGFRITASDGRSVFAEKIIVALGNAASPSLGGTAETYRLLSPFGVTATKLTPSVVSLLTDTRFTRALKGLRVDARLTLFCDGKALASSHDELLFTDSGLSGPAALFVSRPVGVWEAEKRGKMTLSIDFLPDRDAKELLSHRRVLDRPAADFLTGLFHRRVGETLCRAAGIDLSRPLSDGDFAKLLKTVTAFSADVRGTAGMRDAQVTAGGVSLAEVDPETLELKKCPGIFVAGEMLDVDGDCGGYNLQWAWSSAHLAAVNAGGIR